MPFCSTTFLHLSRNLNNPSLKNLSGFSAKIQYDPSCRPNSLKIATKFPGNPIKDSAFQFTRNLNFYFSTYLKNIAPLYQFCQINISLILLRVKNTFTQSTRNLNFCLSLLKNDINLLSNYKYHLAIYESTT